MQWPKYDKNLIIEDMITIAVQFKGKTRGTIEISPDTNENDAMKIVKKTSFGVKYLSQGKINKIVYIPGKIINIIN